MSDECLVQQQHRLIGCGFMFEMAWDDLDPLARCDALEPATRKAGFDLSLKGRQSSWLPDMILLALDAIEQKVRVASGNGASLYVFGDAALGTLVAESAGVQLSDERLCAGMAYLDLAKLIYRFPCAIKFGVEDARVKQVRLNSWGRIYLDKKRLRHERCEQQDVMLKRLDAWFSSFSQEYRSILTLLRRPITSRVASDIRRLNLSLPLGLVS